MEKVRAQEARKKAAPPPPVRHKNDSVKRKIGKVRAEEKKKKTAPPPTDDRLSDSVKRKIEKVRAEEAAQKKKQPRSQTSAQDRGTGYVPPRFRGGEETVTPPRPARKESSRNGLLDQTPSARRAQTKGKRRLDPGSMHRSNVRRSFRVKKKRTVDWRRVLTTVGLTVLFYSLIAGAVIGLYSYNLLRSAAKDNETVTVRIGTETEKGASTKKLRRGDLFYSDTGMMIDMNALADYCEMTVTGDQTDVRFFVRGTEPNLVALRVGSRTAVINGTLVSLPHEAERWGEDIYVPAELITRYMTGVHIDYDEEKETVQISRDRVEGIYSRTEYVPVSFLLRPFGSPDPIDYDALDEEIRLGIEARWRGSEAERQDAEETEETEETT